MASGDQCGASGSCRREHAVLARYPPPCGTFGSLVRRLELGLVEEEGWKGLVPTARSLTTTLPAAPPGHDPAQ